MEYKSNITIASNIYVRKDRDVKNDPDFVHNCRGGIALRELNSQLFGTNVSTKLTSVQNEECKQDMGCSLARDKQMTHGMVKRGDTIVWECRCEYESCLRFSECMPNPIVRVHDISPVSEYKTVTEELQYEWLGQIDQILERPAETLAEIEEEPISWEFTEVSNKVPGEYITLNNQATIIEAGINSHILVNAGPGTGKTHTVIERLAYIIKSGEVDLGQVLVLCYTNAARDVILARLSEKGLSEQARQLVICTMDSLAWSYLAQKTDDNLFGLGFNGCIERFNKEFNAEEWSDFEYVIIDELQDLVNERAKMTLNILNALECGYLLLGDKCQAIYDYDCDGAEKINSMIFYRYLDALLPDDAIKYELVGNRRQSTELAHRTRDFRDALLNLSAQETNEYFNAVINEIPSKTFSPSDFKELSKGTTAILTRNNGEAEWISARLHKNRISHTLLRSVTPRVSLNRWIADVFWDYRERQISKKDFIERYCARVTNNEKAAQDAYEAILCSLFSEPANYFSILEFINVLKHEQDIPRLLLNAPTESLTVSTIHKAKGREFDHVYLLSAFKPSSDNTEEARVWYVGATRPKSNLETVDPLKVYVSKSTPMGRRILTGQKYHYSYCKQVVVGLPEDIDSSGFIKGDLMQAVNTQEYIASHVKVNDPVELIYNCNENSYRIIHGETDIGCLNIDVTNDFWAAVRRTHNKKNIPPRLTEVYVNNIVSVVPKTFPSGVDTMFKEFNIWLGVEVTGFAKADWHWGG